jgi:hypothetical protein
VAKRFPSIDRSTEAAPTAVHCSWIIVGALHTGRAGLTLNPLMRTLDWTAVEVVVLGAMVVAEVVGDSSVVVVLCGTVEDAVVVVAETDALWPLLLHAPSARAARARATTGAGRPMSGG